MMLSEHGSGTCIPAVAGSGSDAWACCKPALCLTGAWRGAEALQLELSPQGGRYEPLECAWHAPTGSVLCSAKQRLRLQGVLQAVSP